MSLHRLKILGVDLSLLTIAGIVGLSSLTGCELLDALTGAAENTDEAARAARDAAEQTTDTLHALEHLLLFTVPAYVVGEARKPLWSKMRDAQKRRKRRKSRRLSGR